MGKVPRVLVGCFNMSTMTKSWPSLCPACSILESGMCVMCVCVCLAKPTALVRCAFAVHMLPAIRICLVSSECGVRTERTWMGWEICVFRSCVRSGWDFVCILVVDDDRVVLLSNKMVVIWEYMHIGKTESPAGENEIGEHAARFDCKCGVYNACRMQLIARQHHTGWRCHLARLYY